MLDLIEEGAFVATGGGRLQPVSKAAVFREFMAPLDLEEEIAARDAEVALAFLVEQGMVEVAGDVITVPASFWSGGQPPDRLIRHTAPRVPWVGQRQSIRRPTTRLLASSAPVLRLRPPRYRRTEG